MYLRNWIFIIKIFQNLHVVLIKFMTVMQSVMMQSDLEDVFHLIWLLCSLILVFKFLLSDLRKMHHSPCIRFCIQHFSCGRGSLCTLIKLFNLSIPKNDMLWSIPLIMFLNLLEKPCTQGMVNYFMLFLSFFLSV